MSFVKTLANMAVGFVAARGMQKYQENGGMDGLRNTARNANLPGGMTDKLGGFAERLGIPGGRNAIQDAMARFGGAEATPDALPPAVDEARARLLIRAMIQAANADGHIDPDERAKIMGHLTDASPAEIAFVNAEMERPADAVALATETPPDQAGPVYSAALMAIDADSMAEQKFLIQLAAALRLPQTEVARIHSELNKPAP